MMTDRPGFLFSSATVGRGVFQIELGLPSVSLIEEDDFEFRTTSLTALARYGVSDDLELRLGAPVYTEVRVEFDRFDDSESGYGDLEVGLKWHLIDGEGARPDFALIPSVIVPTGEDGFSVEDPVYQLNAALEWSLAGGWGLMGLGGVLSGEEGDGGRFYQETAALNLWRTLPSSPDWSVFGELAFITTDLGDGAESVFLGGGVEYLVSNDLQLDAFFDRGLTDESPDWLFGLGLSARF